MNEQADTLDQKTKDVLDAILHKDQHELTEEDKGILRARAFYIKEKHQQRYPDVFTAQPQVTQEPKKNRGRKSSNPPAEVTAPVEEVASLEHPAVQATVDEDNDDDSDFIDSEDEDLDDDSVG
jgi:hypothetical protein